MVVFRRPACTDGFSSFRIDCLFPLSLPVQFATGFCHPVILFPGVGNAFGNVCRVCRNPAGDDALFHIFHVGQGQVFCRRHITQKRRAGHSCHGPADGCRNVIVARSDIRNQGSQYIKRRAFTDRLLYFHVSRNLIQRHMTRAFHHDLHILFPGPLRQFA